MKDSMVPLVQGECRGLLQEIVCQDTFLLRHEWQRLLGLKATGEAESECKANKVWIDMAQTGDAEIGAAAYTGSIPVGHLSAGEHDQEGR